MPKNDRDSVSFLWPPPPARPFNDQAEEQGVCTACLNTGILNAPVRDCSPQAVLTALVDGGKLCDCESGRIWMQYLAPDLNEMCPVCRKVAMRDGVCRWCGLTRGK